MALTISTHGISVLPHGNISCLFYISFYHMVLVRLLYPPVGLPYPSVGLPYPPVGLPYPPVGLPYPPVGLPFLPVGLPFLPVGIPGPIIYWTYMYAQSGIFHAEH